MAATDAHRIPVIVGVGQLNDRPQDDATALDTLDLMRAALELADKDAGGGFLAQAQYLGVVEQMSWPKAHWPGGGKITPYLIEALGISPRLSDISEEPSGDSPIRLIHDAANLIGEGRIEVAAIVGAEALRTEAKRAAAAAAAGNPPKRDVVRESSEHGASSLRKRYGLTTPTDVYPLYENGTRAAWHQSLPEAQRETAAIWSGMSKVAAENPGAWLRRPLEPEDILTVSADNRPISFPYGKLMVANSSVNQGAGVIVTSLAKARAMGVPEDRLVYIGAGAAAHESDDFLERDRYDRSAGMNVSIGRTLALNGLTGADLDCVELYSCFPCVPKMARRVLSWPLDKPHSVYGGLTFGGGPIANCMMHAAVCMAEKLRRGDRRGLIFANGGFATHNHSIVLSRDPLAVSFPQDYDYQAEADAARDPVPPLLERYAGPGTLETYTVPFGRTAEPLFGTVIARTPQGERFVCGVPKEDVATLRILLSGDTEPVGMAGTATERADGYVVWQFAP